MKPIIKNGVRNKFFSRLFYKGLIDTFFCFFCGPKPFFVFYVFCVFRNVLLTRCCQEPIPHRRSGRPTHRDPQRLASEIPGREGGIQCTGHPTVRFPTLHIQGDCDEKVAWGSTDQHFQHKSSHHRPQTLPIPVHPLKTRRT